MVDGNYGFYMLAKFDDMLTQIDNMLSNVDKMLTTFDKMLTTFVKIWQMFDNILSKFDNMLSTFDKKNDKNWQHIVNIWQHFDKHWQTVDNIWQHFVKICQNFDNVLTTFDKKTVLRLVPLSAIRKTRNKKQKTKIDSEAWTLNVSRYMTFSLVYKQFPGSRETLQGGFLECFTLFFWQFSVNVTDKFSIKNREFSIKNRYRPRSDPIGPR